MAPRECTAARGYQRLPAVGCFVVPGKIPFFDLESRMLVVVLVLLLPFLLLLLLLLLLVLVLVAPP